MENEEEIKEEQKTKFVFQWWGRRWERIIWRREEKTIRMLITESSWKKMENETEHRKILQANSLKWNV